MAQPSMDVGTDLPAGSNNSIESDDFKEVRPWTALTPNQQNGYAAYRQPDNQWWYRYRDVYDQQLLQSFNRDFLTKSPATHWFDPQFSLARIINAAKSHLDDLEHLADSRNTLLDAPPARDGSTLQDPAHLEMHAHLRELLGHLFGRGLIRSDHYIVPLPLRYNDEAFQQFVLSSLDARILMDSQKLRDSTHIHRPLRQELQWLGSFRRSVIESYEAIRIASSWAQHGNLDPREVLKQVSKDIPEMTRLLAILLERESAFDHVVHAEHIFGCLIDKRVHLFDPLTLTHIHDHTVRATNVEDLTYVHQQYQLHLQRLYAYIRTLSADLRKLFSFRYLMEWTWNKLWDQLYVVINPQHKISAQCIKRFQDWAKNNGTIARNIFSVHPVTIEELRDSSCTVCLEDFANDGHPVGVMVVKTNCGHYFHPKCLLTSWDRPSSFSNRCPLCRASAGKLRNVMPLTDAEVMEDRDQDNADNTQQMNDIYYNQVDMRAYLRHNFLAGFGTNREIYKVYWDRRIENEILGPQRAIRAAQRASWETALGG